jgi:hypothetical protein
MRDRLFKFMSGFTVVGIVLTGSTAAYAQGGVASSLSGTVVDSSGAVIPGVDIKAKNNATAGEFNAVTTENGTFTIPSLQPGTYTVTVSLMGFKTAVLSAVTLNAGVPGSVKVTLEVGRLEQSVVVIAESSAILQTQSPTVATTLNVNQITNLPLTSRNALDFIVNLPGTNTPGGSRDSTINGLPQSTINITLDGMNIQDNYLKTTDGFFARLSPRLDAVEEVTVTTAANGADSAGQGAVNIRFVTRSGSNTFTGSSYYYLRHDGLNANTWFNNRDLPPDSVTGKAPKNQLRQYQPGTRVGGPIVIPGIFNGHDKAFFFVNYEENRTPSLGTLNRTILSPDAQAGTFLYTTSSGVQRVNLLALAAQNGHVATVDPIVGKLLADIRTSTKSTGQVTDLADPSLQRFTFQIPTRGYTPAPTVRLDYNLTDKHRLTGSFNYQHINSNPDTTNNQQVSFPGFPVYGSQQSTRYTTMESLRSTISANVVNELRVGATGGATFFSPEKTQNPGWWSANQPLANQGGFHLAMNTTALPITNAGVTPTPSSREASTKVFEDTLNWIKGSHTISLGGSLTQADLWLKNQTLVPAINFGIATGDPADAMFTTGNFPGASTAQLNTARALYSVLVGRINSITGNARLNEQTNEYQYLGLGVQRGRMREFGFFAQDSWRMTSNLTVNAGLRYELQRPFYPRNNSYATATVEDVWGVSGVGNLFKPGVLTGKKPQFIGYTKGTEAYHTDWNNFAPAVGFAWQPGTRSGLIGRILGDESVLRAGYSIAYNRPGMSDFSDVFSTNPGITLTANRDPSLGTLGTVPLLFRETDRLGPPPFPKTQQYPFTEVITGDLDIFDPNLQVPYSQTWTVSWGRKLTRDIAVDIRYVGTRHLEPWQDVNYNEANIVQNGFLDEFRKAQANLQANIAAGRGATFAYTGIAGTSPLPIYLAYLNGVPSVQAGDASKYTGSSWTSTNFTNPLAKFNPNPFTPAGVNNSVGSNQACASASASAMCLDGDPGRRANAATAGLPANFFRANPDLLGGAFITGNGGGTRHESMQIELRKRLSHGLQFGSSYVYGINKIANRFGFRTPLIMGYDTGEEGGVTHAFKGNWVYELPFGRGRAFLSNSGGLLDRIVGGWSFDGIARIQSGRLLDFGNVRLVGMSVQELRDSIEIQDYAVTGLNAGAPIARYVMPKDIVENTVRAFSTSPSTTTGYGSFGPPTGRYLAPANSPDCIETTPGFGDCGVRELVVIGPTYMRFDLSVEKRVKVAGRSDFIFRAEMLNAFNQPNFSPTISTSSTADNYRTTSVQENSSRIIQIVTRFSW